MQTGIKKFFEKTEAQKTCGSITYQGRFMHNIKRKIQTKNNYNGEFDPGSGLTLAAGLTHASRGASGVAIPAGDRRTGA